MGLDTVMSRPFRANGCGVRRRPRALPWAGMYRPFGAGRTRTTSISLRSIIFRELVANIIAHREYTSAAPATMMIYADRVEFKNPNVPHKSPHKINKAVSRQEWG